MFGEQALQDIDQRAFEAMDQETLAAILLRLPQTQNPRIDQMIRRARVIETARQLAIAELATAGGQKDVFKLLAREVVVAQQVEGFLDKLGNT